MNAFALTLLSLTALVPAQRDCYLVEDDLVYARFLALARDGTYRQNNRDALAARATEILESERTGDDHLVPGPRCSPALFFLPGSVDQAADLANVRRMYKVKPMSAPPFYFSRIDARKYAAGVQPLPLPGNTE